MGQPCVGLFFLFFFARRRIICNYFSANFDQPNQDLPNSGTEKEHRASISDFFHFCPTIFLIFLYTYVLSNYTILTCNHWDNYNNYSIEQWFCSLFMYKVKWCLSDVLQLGGNTMKRLLKSKPNTGERKRCHRDPAAVRVKTYFWLFTEAIKKCVLPSLYCFLRDLTRVPLQFSTTAPFSTEMLNSSDWRVENKIIVIT